MKKIEEYVRTIPDFPEPGIMFRDITTVLQDAEGFHLAIDELNQLIQGLEFDAIVGAESRGFILGAPLAYERPFLRIMISSMGKPRSRCTRMLSHRVRRSS